MCVKFDFLYCNLNSVNGLMDKNIFSFTSSDQYFSISSLYLWIKAPQYHNAGVKLFSSKLMYIITHFMGKPADLKGQYVTIYMY